MKMKSLCLLVALCLPVSLARAADGAQADYLYIVQPGDNLSTFAQTILDTARRWPEVARYNQLKNPQVITPGQVLRVRQPWLKSLPAEASIESLQGAVTLNGQPARVGDKVASGARLETPAGASVRLGLPDGSTLNMLERTRLEAGELAQKKQSGFFSTAFRLVTGRIDAIKKKYPDGQSPLRIEANHGTIGVRGTHFRMGQEGENTLAEIESGLIAFGDAAVAAPIALGAAQGSVGDGVHAPVMIPLLPAPQFPDMSRDFPPLAMQFSVAALPGARGYRGELAADAEYTRLLAQVSSDSESIRIEGLQEGQYWLRLRAVDEHGLQGMTASTRLVVKQHAAAPSMQIALQPTSLSFAGNRLHIDWPGEAGLHYQCQMSGSRDFSFPLVDIVVGNNELSIPAPDRGHYFVRVRAINTEGDKGDWSAELAFDVN